MMIETSLFLNNAPEPTLVTILHATVYFFPAVPPDNHVVTVPVPMLAVVAVIPVGAVIVALVIVSPVASHETQSNL
jgi:hypothetical protein